MESKLSPFDFVKSITDTKEDLYQDHESEYNRFIVNRALSFNTDCIFFLHELEKFGPNVPDLAHYHFLLNSISKRRRYGSWVKKDTLPDDVKLIQEAYGYSVEDALSALELLSDKQLLELKDNLRKGGKP